MLTGEPTTKEDFKYLSKHGIRSIAQNLVEPRYLEDLVAAVPEDTITGFHLRDILLSTKKYTDQESKLYDCIMNNKRFPKTLGHSFEDSIPDSEEEPPKKLISFDLNKFFTDIGAPECLNRLYKQDLLDPELFFKIEIGALEGCLDLKPEGKKQKVMKKVKELREKYEKDGKIEYLDHGLLELPEDMPQLKFQKSTTMLH